MLDFSLVCNYLLISNCEEVFMNSKPECFVLSGKWGKKVYEDIMNAKPLVKPLFTKNDSAKFDEAFAKIVPEIISNYSLKFGTGK